MGEFRETKGLIDEIASGRDPYADPVHKALAARISELEAENAGIRRKALEEAAAVAGCHADDRRGRYQPIDWHDGYMDGCQGAAAAIKSLIGKEGA